MNAWWKKPYINRRDWILSNLEELTLTSDECLVLLLVDYLNSQHIMVTHVVLKEKLKKSLEEIDELLNALTTKGYMQVTILEGAIAFQIDGVFEDEEQRKSTFDMSLFDAFETELARPLSQHEVARLGEWSKMYESKIIFYALREAAIYEKVNFDYIDRILLEWKKKGIDATAYEEGKR